MTANSEKKSEPPRPDKGFAASVIELKKHTSRESSGPVSGFAAQIDGAKMADLIQLECTRGLTRAIRVTAGDETGFLYFDQGQLVHAITGRLTGEPAAREILRWQGGTVRPSDSYWINPPTIDISWQALLISAAQAEDDSNRLESEALLKVRTESQPVRTENAAKEDPKEEIQGLNDDSENEFLRWARLSTEGQLLEGGGELGEFSDVAAYVAQLAEVIGQGLGLEDFQGLECTSSDRVMLLYRDGAEIVALEGNPTAALLERRKKAGL